MNWLGFIAASALTIMLASVCECRQFGQTGIFD